MKLLRMHPRLLLPLLVPSNQLSHLRNPIRAPHVRPRDVRRNAHRLSDMVDMYRRNSERPRDRVEARVRQELVPTDRGAPAGQHGAQRAQERGRRREARRGLGVDRGGEVEQRCDRGDYRAEMRVVNEAWAGHRAGDEPEVYNVSVLVHRDGDTLGLMYTPRKSGLSWTMLSMSISASRLVRMYPAGTRGRVQSSAEM